MQGRSGTSNKMCSKGPAEAPEIPPLPPLQRGGMARGGFASAGHFLVHSKYRLCRRHQYACKDISVLCKNQILPLASNAYTTSDPVCVPFIPGTPAGMPGRITPTICGRSLSTRWMTLAGTWPTTVYPPDFGDVADAGGHAHGLLAILERHAVLFGESHQVRRDGLGNVDAVLLQILDVSVAAVAMRHGVNHGSRGRRLGECQGARKPQRQNGQAAGKQFHDNLLEQLREKTQNVSCSISSANRIGA